MSGPVTDDTVADEALTSEVRIAAMRTVEHEIGVLMRRVRRAVAERAREVHPDLLPAGYLVLAQVHEDGRTRASDLGCTLQLDKGAVSRTVQHLLDLGLLDRAPDPDDGRATLLSVSALGRRRFRAVDEQRRRALQDRFTSWSSDDLLSVSATLRRYNASFDQA